MTRIPGGIKYDDPISANQVDPQAASSGGHKEEHDLRVSVELVDEPLPLLGTCAAVQAVVVHSGFPIVLKTNVNEIQC